MKKPLLAILIVTTILAGCSKVPLTGRKQLSALPESQVVSMSLSEYSNFLAQNKVINGTADADMVKRVGARLASAVEQFLKDNNLGDRIKDFQWEYNLVESKEANAWCMPGGKIVVYTGILPITQNEPGLAVVLAHEIGHAVARHGNERMSQMLAQQLGGLALDVALSSKPQETHDIFMAAYGLGTNVGIILPYSRTQESEADRLGLNFMAMAGYDPHQALDFWNRMKAAETNAPPEFLSDHPSTARRIKDIGKYMPEAMSHYKGQ